jgi:adenylate kinase
MLNRHRQDSATRIGITGSPATGKKTVGAFLSKELGLEIISINEYALTHKLGVWKKGEFEVDTESLKGKILTKDRIVVGHLLPYVIPKRDLDFVAILRCSPLVLMKRYLERAYSEPKIEENLEAEALDIIAQKALDVFGREKVSEFDTTSKKSSSVAYEIVETLAGRRKYSFSKIGWLNIKSERELKRLLSGK